MYLTSVDDLRNDTLFRAGEPQDSTSSFWTKSIEYLTRIQGILLLGGGAAVGRDLATSAGIYAHVVDLPITDWWWARRRGVLTTSARLQRTLTTGLSQGATSISVTATVNQNLAGYYVRIPGYSTVMRFIDHKPGISNLPLDGPWPETIVPAQTVIDIFRLEYDLANDFIRFASPPYVHSLSGRVLPVGTMEQFEGPGALSQTGVPSRAYMIGAQKISLNRYADRPYRLEYEYVALPPNLQPGGLITGIPAHHRTVLSTGAAMLICFDKGDGRTENLASEYRELVRRMVQEHRKLLSSGSPTFGVFKFRARQSRTRGPQPFGELYLT